MSILRQCIAHSAITDATLAQEHSQEWLCHKKRIVKADRLRSKTVELGYFG